MNESGLVFAFSQQTIIGGSIAFKYRYATEEQLIKLRKRSVYCSQTVVHTCIKSPVFAQGRCLFLFMLNDMTLTFHWTLTSFSFLSNAMKILRAVLDIIEKWKTKFWMHLIPDHSWWGKSCHLGTLLFSQVNH